MSVERLVDVLKDARALLLRPENHFEWSRWNGADQAVAELDALLARIEAANTIKLEDVEVLFAATGPIQEVSLPSGWGDDFLRLAEQFDQATADL